jgi:hypothetical protein
LFVYVMCKIIIAPICRGVAHFHIVVVSSPSKGSLKMNVEDTI